MSSASTRPKVISAARSAARWTGYRGVNPARCKIFQAVVTLTVTWNIRPISVQTLAKVQR
jgi:hypothetical protein